MKKTIKLITVFLAVISFSLVFYGNHFALADTASTIKGGACEAAGGTCPSDSSGTLSDTVATVINVLSAVVGVLAVIMIIVGGLRYITSAGNPEGAKTARNTILYAIIGLVIVALAQLIVHFVLNKSIQATTPKKAAVDTYAVITLP